MLEHENQARNRTTKDAKVFNELKSTELLISRLNRAFSSFARSSNKTTSYAGKAFEICIVSHFTRVQADFKLRCYVYTGQLELLEGGVKNTVVDWGRDVSFGSNYREVREIGILPDIFDAISWMCVVCCSAWVFTD